MSDYLAAHALNLADKIAVIDERPDGSRRELSYAELNAEVNRLANALLAAGVRPGERLVWCGQNSLEVVLIFHAARKAGIGAVPLNYRLTAEEAEYIINDSDAVLVLTDVARAPLIAGIQARLLNVRQVIVFGGAPLPAQRSFDEFVAGAPEHEPEVETTEEQVIYTSGTTGRPKGAVRSTQGSAEQRIGLILKLGVAADDVHLTTGPLYHSGPLAFFGAASIFGNTVVLLHHFSPEEWLRLVDKYKVNSTFAAPAPIRMICSLPAEVKARYDCRSMKRMIANAAPWSMALKEAYLADFPEESLYEVYGATELGVVTVLLPEDQRRKPGSCGQPAPHVEVALFDDDGVEVVEPNVPGELFVRASSVFDTYHKAQDKFDAEHRGDWHTVGDVAYRDEEGFLYICDRKKDMIISGGMNIYPAELEAVLENHAKVYDVAVLGLPSEEWGETVHAVVVADPTLTLAELADFARLHLASYKVPRSLSFVDEIPRNGSGKILKRELRAGLLA